MLYHWNGENFESFRSNEITSLKALVGYKMTSHLFRKKTLEFNDVTFESNAGGNCIARTNEHTVWTTNGVIFKFYSLCSI